MEGMQRAILFAGLFLLFTFLSLQPISSYDYFWHLATGRWIIDHGALPLHDPFALASDRIPWLNGSWLYQAISYVAFTSGGHAAVAILRSVVVGLTFAGIATLLARRIGPSFATLITLLCFAGAAHRLGVRPETFAIACCVAAVALLRGEPTRRKIALFALVSVVWMNLHPSALLAPFLAALDTAGDAAKRRTVDAASISRIVRTVVSAVVLLINPHGLAGITAPLQLASQVTAGTFVNTEWLPGTPMQFPGLYLAASIGVVVIIATRRGLQSNPVSSQLPARELIFALFAYLAIRYVRNHGFFFATLPLLLEAHVGELLDRADIGTRLRHVATAIAAVTAGVFVMTHVPAARVDASRFPVAALQQLQQSGLYGRIYNPDQFGGFLIWTYYPERVTLTDGRNELYRSFLVEYDRARVDSRAWNALMRKYQLTLAVEEYRARPLEVRDPRTGATRPGSPSLAFFPRRQWALVGFDDVAMVFARRDAFDPALIARLEFKQLRPDLLSRGEVSDVAAFMDDLKRASSLEGGERRISALIERLGLQGRHFFSHS